MNKRVVTIEIASLQESVFEGKRLITFPVLRECISENGYIYSKEVAESFAPLLKEKRKMYLDHSVDGRKMHEWVATIQKVWAEDGVTRVQCRIAPHQMWLYELAKEEPGEVQVSIDAMAYVEVVERDQREFYKVTEWIRARSVDFVTEASVPGAKVELVESRRDVKRSSELFEAVTDTLQYRLDKIKDNRDEGNKQWDIEQALSSFMSELSLVDPKEEDIKKTINSFCDDLSKKLQAIVGKYASEYVMMSKDQFISQFGDIITEGKRILTEINRSGKMELTLKAVRETPEIYDAIKAEVMQALSHDSELDELKKNNGELQKTIEQLKEEKITLTGKLDVMEAEQKKIKLETFLVDQLQGKGLTEVVSDDWKQMVLENATEDTIKVQIDQLSKLNSAKVENIQAENNNNTVESGKKEVDLNFVK